MRPRRISLITAVVCFAGWIIALDDHALCETASSEIVDFIQAETANTIVIKEKVAFMSPSGKEIIPAAGTYQVELLGADLRLVPFGKKETFVIKAESTTHHEDVGDPVALIAVDEQYLVHVVLLLPGQKGLEAVGSSGRGRHRGLPQLLSPTEIHDALTQKSAGERVP